MILAAGTTGTVIATVAAFLLITLILVSLLLFVKQKLSPSGPVKILSGKGETRHGYYYPRRSIRY